jgi:prepilin-type N-terminal cleavage/methylation domain-containing protein
MTSAQLDARRSRAMKPKADPLPAFSFQLRAGRSPRGFTLLEVMVALCILAIVLLSVYRLHSQTISMSIESRFYTQAPLLARSALTRWEEARKPEMISDQGDFGKEFPGYQWKISVADAPSPALGAQFTRDMQRIDVQVTLNNGEYSYEFRTYRFKRE